MVILTTNKKQATSKIARLYHVGEKNIKKKRDFYPALFYLTRHQIILAVARNFKKLKIENSQYHAVLGGRKPENF